MSNAGKPFVLQHAVPQGVVATRWWWVRHAPVRDDGGNIYGQKDMPCDCSDGVVFDAVGNQPEKGLAFTIDNCSITRLDHLASDGHSGWRIPFVNQQPWIADASHAAMHQPAGPEVVPPTKLA